MSSPIVPEYRLRNFARALRDLLLGRRLAADSERTGVVELGDYGKRCEKVVELGRATLEELAEPASASQRCLARVAEELELSCRLAALMETLPRTKARIETQCQVLESLEKVVAAAERSGCMLEEEPALLSMSVIARRERKAFEPLMNFEGTIRDVAPAMIDRGPLLRRLRRALLDHDGASFALSVDERGRLHFENETFAGEAVPDDLTRSGQEPEGVRKILDLREATPDQALKDFLLVKAVDEALATFLVPRLGDVALREKARGFPRRPGKRMVVRPEAVTRPPKGWDAAEAARGIEKLAAARHGPEWARLPKGAYLLRLLLHEDDALAQDLLALGPVLRRMEKGEAVMGMEQTAARALRSLLGLLG